MPAGSLTHSPSDKAEVAVAAATFKASVLDADVVAVVVAAAIRVVAVTKDVADADTTVGAKVRTTKETKAPTTKATWALATKAVGAGPTTCFGTARVSECPELSQPACTRHRDGTYQCRWFAELKLLVIPSRAVVMCPMTKAL